MKRALKFLLVFLGSAFVIVLAAGIPNYSAFKALFANTEGMREGYEYIESTFSLKALTEFIGDHPEYMSVVSFNVDNPDSGIYYQPDVPRSLGALSNFFLLAEYERQVSEGGINPNQEISLSELDKYFLPQISQSDNDAAIEALSESGELTKTTLDQIVSVMIETNSLGLSDYVWFALGGDNIFALMDTLDIENTDNPLPFSGLYLSIHPDFSDTSKTLSEENVIALAERFINDEPFNKEVKKLLEEKRLNLSFIGERDGLNKFPQTTAREMAMLMASLQRDELISTEVSGRIKEKMTWVYGGGAVQRSFSDYGAIYDDRMGMLSGIDFGTSIFDNHTSAQAVFFDKLPVAFFIHLSANHMQEDYQQRLIWDPALYETTQKEIQK